MPNSVRETIFEAIREEITYGELLPGERLTEKDLSEKFKASRSTIRECLRLLEGEGLLTYASNKGYRVSKLSIKQVEEIYDLRRILESYATRLTAEKATKAQVAHLRKLQAGCRRAADKSDLKLWIRDNSQFHKFFYENCDNDNLRLLLDTLKRRIYRYQYIIINISDQFTSYLEVHDLIIEACAKQDGRAAEKAMKTHLSHIQKVLMEYLKKFPGLYPV
ncbi:MAG: GntR family transcriptional regulator [Desulfarculaceae bacterium]|nr:GntR family transcriptional regulator [Desulfarculaceae bacterium]MCF8073235.1 GntR family transcriptional regulator [Desulfarculaceae bacterium]MCF8100831.1 GntR family transcriptional regulator [Desulfarculaceae bacterium]MCF8118205.1 GntR family transcriptional regulator [Desulfarculaceae bacterium]